MIQRIQTIYLLLAIISLVLMIFVPMGSLDFEEYKELTSENVYITQIIPLLDQYENDYNKQVKARKKLPAKNDAGNHDIELDVVRSFRPKV